MTTFGEIVEPLSRAAWEDWDDHLPESNYTKLAWLREPLVPGEIDTLLILEGKYLSDCIKMQNANKLELVNSIPKVHLQLFRSNTSYKYICILKDYNLVLSSEIVELIKPYLSVAKEVIAIQTKPLNEYQAMDTSSQDCIIRMICTTKCPEQLNINFPKLEQPNIIAGVSAGVITLREHLDQTGVALVCYMEHPEEYQIEEVEKLLEKLNITPISASRPSSVLNSNLYI